MHNHWTPDQPRAFGLCHVSFFEEDLSTSMQLVGAAAVRGRMLQLVPGETFVAAAARSVMYLPPTLGDAALDGSAARMREWMDLATRVAMGGDMRTLRELEQGGVRLSDYIREESGAASLPEGGTTVEAPRSQTVKQCDAPGASSSSSSSSWGPSVLVQAAHDAVGDFTLTASQYSNGVSLDSAPPLAGHGTLPRDPFDHIGREPSTLPGEGLGPRTPQGSGAGVQGGGQRGEEEEEECTEEEEKARRPATMRLTAAGWVPDNSPKSRYSMAGEPRQCKPRASSASASGQHAARGQQHAAAAAGTAAPSSARQLGEMGGGAKPTNPLLFGAAYVPFATEVPLTYFKVDADLFVGSAAPLNAQAQATARATEAQQPHPSSAQNDGQGGLWICYSDLEPSELAAAIPTSDGVGQPSYSGSGVVRPAAVAFEPLACLDRTSRRLHASDTLVVPCPRWYAATRH